EAAIRPADPGRANPGGRRAAIALAQGVAAAGQERVRSPPAATRRSGHIPGVGGSRFASRPARQAARSRRGAPGATATAARHSAERPGAVRTPVKLARQLLLPPDSRPDRSRDWRAGT